MCTKMLQFNVCYSVGNVGVGEFCWFFFSPEIQCIGYEPIASVRGSTLVKALAKNCKHLLRNVSVSISNSSIIQYCSQFYVWACACLRFSDEFLIKHEPCLLTLVHSVRNHLGNRSVPNILCRLNALLWPMKGSTRIDWAEKMLGKKRIT